MTLVDRGARSLVPGQRDRACATVVIVVRSVAYVNLARSECWSLLRDSAVGRVVYTYEAMPAVALVNYALVGELIVFAVGERSKLAG
ncbi:MAG: pyridoxamine 5'-phosphate oxidase family protein, partial [Streptosporangiales bacterium]|nr:pyridoxamine 5'-phosphate oxidase family protein [Streptosporangiales bacterium]